MNNSNQPKAYLFLVLTTSAWGSLYVVSKYIMASIPPFTVLLCRYFVAGLALLLLLKTGMFQKNGQTSDRKRIEKKDYKYIFLIGSLGYFVSIAAQLVGTKLSSAGLASLLNSLNPIFMLIFAVPFLNERITLTKVISVVAALIGVYIILGGGKTNGVLWGAVASLVSVVIWSLTSVTVKQITQKYDPLAVTTYAILVAFVCTIPFSAYELVTTPNVQIFRPGLLAGLLYIGLVCTAMTNVLWNMSLSMIEAGRCALFYPLQPMVAALLGCLFLGETVRASFVIGAAFILGGVLFSVLSEKISKKIRPHRHAA